MEPAQHAPSERESGSRTGGAVPQARTRDVTPGIALARLGGVPDSTAQPHLVRSRSAAAVIAEAATHIEQEGRLPAPVLAAMHDAALFRLSLPAWLGGAELPLAELAEITELIAGADASAGWCLGQALGCATAAAYLDPRGGRAVFGPRDRCWPGVLGRRRAVPPTTAIA